MQGEERKAHDSIPEKTTLKLSQEAPRYWNIFHDLVRNYRFQFQSNKFIKFQEQHFSLFQKIKAHIQLYELCKKKKKRKRKKRKEKFGN